VTANADPMETLPAISVRELFGHWWLHSALRRRLRLGAKHAAIGAAYLAGLAFLATFAAIVLPLTWLATRERVSHASR
jgi:hypothetical protein